MLEYERLHCDTCDPAKVSLLRFQGRPFELSPKARLKTALGTTAPPMGLNPHWIRYSGGMGLGLAPRPFDRHDWTVDRCGTEARYIIDCYSPLTLTLTLTLTPTRCEASEAAAPLA